MRACVAVAVAVAVTVTMGMGVRVHVVTTVTVRLVFMLANLLRIFYLHFAVLVTVRNINANGPQNDIIDMVLFHKRRHAYRRNVIVM